MKILHLDSSVSGPGSVSRPLTQEAADKLKSLNPGAEYIYRDLVKDTLRHYNAVLRVHGDDVSNTTPEQKQELEIGKDILAEFLGADAIVMGAPMYNFSVPSQLKAWIDLVVIPGTTFSYGPNGVEGKCKGKKLIIISTRGGAYGPGSPFEPFDHQARYLKDVFAFLGITDITIITAEGVSQGPEKKEAALQQAKAQIASLN